VEGEKRMNDKRKESAFTLMEMMVVIVIAGILTAGSIFVLTKTGRYYKLRETVAILHSDCTLMRQYAEEKSATHAIAFTATGWKTLIIDNGVHIISSNDFPNQVRLGYTGSISKKADGSSGSPPTDGIDFPSDTIFFYKTRSASPGAVYFTNGDETRAVLVNSIGMAQVLIWDGGNWKEQ